MRKDMFEPGNDTMQKGVTPKHFKYINFINFILLLSDITIVNK